MVIHPKRTSLCCYSHFDQNNRFHQSIFQYHYTMSTIPSILCVPNLQGQQTPNLAGVEQAWVPPANTLPAQVENIQATYGEHPILIGSSFGGLAAWKFAYTTHSQTLQCLILIDVLPTLSVFPSWKSGLLNLANYLPHTILQSSYTLYRQIQGEDQSVDIDAVLSRIRSFQKDFPQPIFPVPTMVLSTNHTFTRVWRQIAGHQIRIQHCSAASIPFYLQRYCRQQLLN